MITAVKKMHIRTCHQNRQFLPLHTISNLSRLSAFGFPVLKELDIPLSADDLISSVTDKMESYCPEAEIIYMMTRDG